MPRKYGSEDFEEQPKPRIVANPLRHGSSTLAVFKFQCKDKVSNSVGYGYTLEHAYRQWLKNWAHRRDWYTQRQQRLESQEREHRKRKAYFADRDKMARALDGFTSVDEPLLRRVK